MYRIKIITKDFKWQ